MTGDQCYTTTLILFVFHTAALCSQPAQINSVYYSRRPSGELSMNNTMEIVNSYRTASLCAARCSRLQHCTAFVYSVSMKVCYLGSTVYVKDSTYPPDYKIFKSDQDYYEKIECSSNNLAYTECAPSYTKSLTITLLQQLSSSSCTLGVSYGVSANNLLWVHHGCRAHFAIGV